MNNNILFVTAYRDIFRNKWNVIPRTNDFYCEAFYKYVSRINYNILVFVDKNIKSYLITKYIFKSNVFFYDIDTCERFYDKYIEIETKIINSDIYKNKIPFDRKDCPEHLYAEYNLVNHSKINYFNFDLKIISLWL